MSRYVPYRMLHCDYILMSKYAPYRIFHCDYVMTLRLDVYLHFTTIPEHSTFMLIGFSGHRCPPVFG